MSCEFMFYDDDEINSSYPYLYCKVTGNRCIYSKKCEKERKFIPNGNLWEECFLMIDERKKHIPKDSFYLECYRPNKKGKLYLYVVIEDKVVKILSDLESIDQRYVYLKKIGENYKVSLVPFPVEEEESKPKKKQPKKKIDEETLED